MHILNFISAIFSGAMNSSSGLFLFNFTGLLYGKYTNPEAIFNTIINFAVAIIYTVFKWILLVIDIIFSYIQQLAGITTNFNSLESIFSGESDLVFNLFYSSKNVVIPIIKTLVILGIIVIILLSIFAIIRSSLKSLDGGGKNQTIDVVKKMLKSFLLMILTPFIAVGGIVASNAILKALYTATNVNSTISLGSQIFSASSMSANSFRNYAKNGKRIPIIYDFSKDNEILEYYSDTVPTSEFLNYITSSDNMIYATYMMFSNNGYINYQEFTNLLNDKNDKEKQDLINNYYLVYDTNANSNISLSNYRRIESYKEEYLVMADLVDYCVRTNNAYYYKTIEEVLYSIASLYSPEKETMRVERNRLFDSLVSYFDIRFIGSDGKTDYTNTINADNFILNDDWKIIRYYSEYYTDEFEDIPNQRITIEYNHLRGETDERLGAKFLMAEERSTIVNGQTYPYFYPLTKKSAENNSTAFTSSYISDGQIISAKGLFDEAEYPTAIRQRANGDVQFYRDKIEDSMVGVLGELGGIRSRFEGSVFNKVITFIRAIFNPTLLLPEVAINQDAVALTYNKNETTICSLSSGKLHISYMFADVLSTVGLNQYQIKISAVYNIRKLNYLLFALGVIILIGVCFKAVQRLINRSFELFLTIMVYPAACATLPIDDGGYKKWFDTYKAKLFATYGVILGINFVFLLIPVIESIEFFDVESVANSRILQKITSLFFGLMSYRGMANVLNFVTAIMFELVLFTMLSDTSGVAEVITTLAGGKYDKESDPIGNFAKTIGKPAKIVFAPIVKPLELGFKLIFDREGLKNDIKKKAGNVFDAVKMSLPGSALLRDFKNWNDRKNKWFNQREAKKNLKKTMASDSSKAEDVQKAMEEYIKATQARSHSLENSTEARRETEKEEKEKNKVTNKEKKKDKKDEKKSKK